MNKLTQEQIKTLEDAFASYPEDYEGVGKYSSMEGIQEQLDELEETPGLVFYVSKVLNVMENGRWLVDIGKIVIG